MKQYLKTHWKHIVVWTVIVSVIVVALRYGIDKKAVVFGTVLIGVFTQAFAGLAALVGALPLIGPFIVKIFALPIIWVIQATGSFVGAVAIKKGYSKEMVKSRVLTLALSIGILIGYIIGHIMPIR
ncbi:MAG: hypothetical protein VYA83_02745 [Candidatus Neomarinimicrobiota bacterium]|jgi:hypothetical protein|nr:hypothetical protein [Candidatus Neomarinimicrobiota bacterium]MEC9437176.1 hypothetical protein [Candidatus Neomarinimicrobiota bacterium]MED5434199.1 hypothetical protein [Candidatus Neomarinimicrobiota bacterium]MEE3302455.1 hypothetical protein [Candidatus Neomarinimicrobiota bacterium]|tara:strand:- start:197 stop:574 length:378 start_codon:yes stop_codon:yes gene_type:complete